MKLTPFYVGYLNKPPLQGVFVFFIDPIQKHVFGFVVLKNLVHTCSISRSNISLVLALLFIGLILLLGNRKTNQSRNADIFVTIGYDTNGGAYILFNIELILTYRE